MVRITALMIQDCCFKLYVKLCLKDYANLTHSCTFGRLIILVAQLHAAGGWQCRHEVTPIWKKRTQNLAPEFAKLPVGVGPLSLEGQPQSDRLLRNLIFCISGTPVICVRVENLISDLKVQIWKHERDIVNSSQESASSENTRSAILLDFQPRSATEVPLIHHTISFHLSRRGGEGWSTGTQRADRPKVYPANGQHIFSHYARLLL